jgi:peptide/nickel transport system permease protein
MRRYIVRRLLQMIPVLIGVSFLIFFIFSKAPGDPVSSMMATKPNMSAEKEAQLRKLYDLDKNVFVRYGTWVKKAVRFDFGDSYKYKEPVSTVMNKYIWNSFYLSLSAFIFSIILAIPIGVISATKQYSVFDTAFTVFALVGISIPSFFFGLLLIKTFAIDLGWFPVAGMTSTGSTATGFAAFLDVMHHMFLPFLVISLMSVAGIMRFVRTSMLEVIRQDFIRTARAKGLKEKVVIYKHALRNGMIPVITLLGMSLPSLFGGSIITEQIFAWPGIGRITIQAINVRDYPLLMGINCLLAALTLIGNLVADISYAVVDPRIRYK